MIKSSLEKFIESFSIHYHISFIFDIVCAIGEKASDSVVVARIWWSLNEVHILCIIVYWIHFWHVCNQIDNISIWRIYVYVPIEWNRVRPINIRQALNCIYLDTITDFFRIFMTKEGKSLENCLRQYQRQAKPFYYGRLAPTCDCFTRRKLQSNSCWLKICYEVVSFSYCYIFSKVSGVYFWHKTLLKRQFNGMNKESHISTLCLSNSYR